MNERLLQEVLLESYEKLDGLDRELVALEKDPGNAAALDGVFRTIHTIKGTCGFLGLRKLEALSHAGEGVLVRIRSGHLLPDTSTTTTLLELGDAIRVVLASLEETGTEGDVDPSAVVAALEQLAMGCAARPAADGRGPHVESRTSDAADPPEPDPDRREEAAGARAVRVDGAVLARLSALAAEIAVARREIVGFAATVNDKAFVAATERLDAAATELQAVAALMRRQAIDVLWSTFPRLVRDLAIRCGKQVRLDMTGQDTTLDTAAVEALRDPLIHLLRNAVDHGIEPADARVGLGKLPGGTIRLRAFQGGDSTIVEMADDGAGIDVAGLKAVAQQRGVITGDQAACMASQDVVRLAFRPGLSTAGRVSCISGRGVGMDIVRTNIEQIGGRVDIESRAGFGTTIRITIPERQASARPRRSQGASH